MASSPEEKLTTVELVSSIENLSDANLLRLRKVAARLASNRFFAAEDLLQEIFCRVIEEVRICPRNVSVTVFLAKAMKSIAYSWVKESKTEPVYLSVEPTNDVDDDPMLKVADQSRSPEDFVADNEVVEQIVNQLLELFDDDEKAQTILEGDMEGMSAEEIRDMLGINKTEYATIRRKIRRRIEKHFPDGWKS